MTEEILEETGRKETTGQEAGRNEVIRQEAGRNEVIRQEAGRNEVTRQETDREDQDSKETVRKEVQAEKPEDKEKIRHENLHSENSWMESGDGYEPNLSDFAFFLSVMQVKEAHRNILSIILEEEDLELLEVRVEQVVLNKKGKRAIRMDAWAVDRKKRQINTEMQNDTEQDDVRKRARFYQSMIDTPVLKAGKKTKYKHLPETIVIFITQEDVFGKDLAKYTFTEQCEEVKDLKLEDGTKKIFLNMKSTNGKPELISLLQYMKETRLDNPNISVKDKRLTKLDEIVQEVKESEEWEAVSMSIYSRGISLGESRGINLGENRKLIAQICKKLKKNKSVECIAEELEESPENIRKICTIAAAYAPDYDYDKICREWEKDKKDTK